MTGNSIQTQDEIKPKRRSRIREAHETRILAAAEDVFAQFGYNGASLETIAEQAGMSKQNMLYYFSSKEILYHRVLKNILDLWLEKMTLLEQAGEDPAAMLENYIRGKFEISRTHPNGSKVFANEIINGAPHLKEYLRQRLLPQLEADIVLVRGWIRDGVIDPIEPEHLFFTIWASTQTYADFSAQIELSLGKETLEADDFTRAGDFLTHVILKGIGLKD
ncbi:TetR/AcrR family transcriptional regulator [Marinobacterium rhizophilum]|uniref:TetR family transcriptional regulator C-terminal domain-containing protein n=1 Tax=Marinobacterium rhizophilum TaxID=420402 RepID=A0ABY5HCZ9_9GAMM|nr:TetR/AcrR family transcriptional regulator [Marinobacterium rhizophilum]UTW10197.1 TetR family transcriptional regulator C-terminal domain-containing protein [Marinobacterium rhizophilum]